jgi:quinol monooxygenase YgiN
MAIGVIAILKVRDDKNDEFERLFADLVAQVRANEPDNIMYQLSKSRTEANTYKVLELYKDQDALAAHRSAPHYKAAEAGLGGVLAGRPDVEYLDTVG